MNFQKLLKEVLQDLLPTKDDEKKVLGDVKSFLAELNNQIKKNKIQAKAVLGGSYAKGTWLKGDYDVDVFVKFAKKHWKENISNLLEKALKQFKYERIHGSRDYFWIRNMIKYEIVPVFDIKKKEDAINVTDFSPLHVGWVNEKGQKYKNDIRLVKKFCKAAECYGAESYIRGFSGHVADIITINYKGFLQLLKAAQKWKPKQIIDYNNTYKGKAIMMLNKSKCEGPMIVVDPVQPQRNAAAALTEENFNKFIKAARDFLKKPSKEFFTEQETDFEKLAKKGKLVKIEVQTLDAKEDVAGAKFVTAYNHIKKALSEFQIIKTGWNWDRKKEGTWWFLLKTDKLPNTVERKGPPMELKEAVDKFKKLHKNTYTQKGIVWAKMKRECTTPREIIEDAIKQEFIKSRVSKVKL